MQPVGKVVNRFSGRLLVKTEAALPIGFKVLGKDGRPVGKVADVIGNVKSPYLLVETTESDVGEIYSK